MARSPERAKVKNDAYAAMEKPTAEAAMGRYLKAPDGFVYAWTEALSKLPGMEEFTGKVDAAGFAAPAFAQAPVQE